MTFKKAALKGRTNGHNTEAHGEAFKFRAALGTNEDLLIQIYGIVGESFFGDSISASQVAEALKTDSKSVTVRINSPGGDCFEGVAIYNLLRASGRPVNVIVDGLAASAASLIAMAGDNVSMGTGTMLMIHSAFLMLYGNSVDMHAAAAVLEKATGNMADIYAARTGQDRETLLKMMYAETWLNPQEAIEEGFADEVSMDASKAGEVAAAYDLGVYNKTPETLKQTERPGTPLANLALRELELYGESKACV